METTLNTNLSIEIFNTLLSKLIEAIKEKIDIDPETLAKYKAKFEALLKLLSKFLDLKEIEEVITNLVAKIKDAIITVIDDFLDSIPLLRELVTFIMDSFKDGSIYNIKLLLKKLFKMGLNEIRKKIEEIFEMAKEAFEKFKEKAKSIFQEFIDRIEVLWDKIKEFFKKRMGDMSRYVVPANIDKNIRMMYSTASPNIQFSQINHARVSYNKLVDLLTEVVGADNVQAELDKLQAKYRNNYIGQYLYAKRTYIKPAE